MKKFYFQVRHKVTEDGTCGKVIAVSSEDVLGAWKKMAEWRDAHPDLEDLVVTAFYGHEPSEYEIEDHLRDDAFFSDDVRLQNLPPCSDAPQEDGRGTFTGDN